MKLQDGYYWAKVTHEDAANEDGLLEIVFVLSGVNIVQRVGEEYYLEFCDVDFGPNPKPIKKPDWSDE